MPLHWWRDDDGRPIVVPAPPPVTEEAVKETLEALERYLAEQAETDGEG